MTVFARFSFMYLVFAIVATVVLYGFSFGHLAKIGILATDLIRYMGAGPWVLWLSPILVYYIVRYPARMSEALYGFVATIALVCGYTLLKGTIPVLVPYWADGMFAQWDLALHGGVAPWELSHRLSAYIDTDGAVRTYSGFWGAFAFSFPAFLALCDQDDMRKMRFLALYALAWIVIGNVFATVFSSVGPIYIDRYYGGDSFAPMIASLKELTFPGTSVDALQTRLWEALITDDGMATGGAAISAFPSMHVAIAVVWAIYMTERSRFFAPVAIGFAVTIIFLSVYTGWHYAVDGYASIVGVLALYAALRQLFKNNYVDTSRNSVQEIDPAHS